MWNDISMVTPLAVNTYVGGVSADNITGSRANDHLFGKAGDDTLYRGSGNGRMEGGLWLVNLVTADLSCRRAA